MLDITPHSAGGKVKTALPAGLVGTAVFAGERDEYRPLLTRHLPGHEAALHALFIGMNPSTADKDFNDPTITREWGFTAREGLGRYVKANVMDYRATDPRSLLAPGVAPRSAGNFPAILGAARKAGMVIICHGRLHPRLAHYGTEAVAALRADGIPLLCFGCNADGSPKHPLYLRSDTPLVPFPFGA
jgi:hypothetical protein